MKCYICDATLTDPKYNRDHESWDPCGTCLSVINDTLETFKDQAVFVDEDDIPLSNVVNFPLT